MILNNDEGNVTVKSIIGDVEIHVDEGDIEISDVVFNELNLSVDEGDINGIDLKNPDGRLMLALDEGDALFENVNVRRLQVECDEGDFIVKNLSCNSCNIATDEGDVELDVELNENDRYKVSADEGNIRFYLSNEPDVELDLETRDGSIQSDFSVIITKKDESHICRDTIGNDNALIEVLVDEGTIFLKRRQ